MSLGDSHSKVFRRQIRLGKLIWGRSYGVSCLEYFHWCQACGWTSLNKTTRSTRNGRRSFWSAHHRSEPNTMMMSLSRQTLICPRRSTSSTGLKRYGTTKARGSHSIHRKVRSRKVCLRLGTSTLWTTRFGKRSIKTSKERGQTWVTFNGRQTQISMPS